MFQPDGGGGLVDMLAPLARRADELLLQVLFPDAEGLHPLLQPAVLRFAHREEGHIDSAELRTSLM